MTNFFLEELRKIYGDGRVIHDPQFVGECCYGSLGDLRVKARFTKDIVANQYGGCRKADCSRVDHCDSPGCRLFKK